MSHLFRSTFVALLAAALTAPAGIAQSFEVATVKPSDPNARLGIGMLVYPGGRITITHSSLKLMVQMIWGVSRHQISGGPRWAGEVLYDIVAKPPASSKSAGINPKNPKLRPPEEEIQMLKALLADRFHLKLREEAKDAPGYALVVGSHGPKLSPPKDPEEYSVVTFGVTGKPDRPNVMRGHNATMERFTQRLSDMLQCPVVDRTGLTGSYDFLFEYTQQPTENTVAPTIFSAIQQIGLKLERTTAPELRLVIEDAEQPSAN